MHLVCYLVFTKASAPSHSFTFSHITHPFSCKSCIQCSLPLHSLTHSSIMCTLCLVHTHHSLYTCRLQHTYCLRHIHCSIHASLFMDVFHFICHWIYTHPLMATHCWIDPPCYLIYITLSHLLTLPHQFLSELDNFYHNNPERSWYVSFQHWYCQNGIRYFPTKF